MTDSPSDRLRAARIKAGFNSAAEAARARGWREATYRHHENGTRGFGKDHARAYGRAFGVSAGWLLDLEASSAPSAVEVATAIIEDYEVPGHHFPEIEEFLNKNSNQSLVYHFQMDDFRDRFFALPDVDHSRAVWVKAFDRILLDLSANIDRSLLFSLNAKDSSMAPTIPKDALMLLDAGQREIDRQDGVWLVVFGGQPMIRRARTLPDDMVELYCDHAGMPLFAGMRDVDVRASVIWAGGRLI
jgi:hypothetical protein